MRVSSSPSKLLPCSILSSANPFSLVDDEPETQLEATLHEMLDDFGRNWIQVKKDRQAHPYAIVQFEKVEAAHDALRNGKGMVLNGRNIRLEKAKVERSVIVTSLAGIGPLTEHEACNMMARFGPIEIIASTDLISDRSTALSRGQYVKFHFWLDCRDALRKFHDHYPNFRIQLASGVEPKMRAFTKSGASIVTGLSRTRANVDVRSIFLGNLPSDVAKNEIFELFGRFGQIQELSLVRKPFPGGLMNTFAFVEFSTAIEANVAAESEVSIRGTKIRIEPKEYTARRKSRLALEASPPASMPATPRPRFASPVRSERTPFRISPAANAALQERLAQNNMVNNALADNFGDRAPNVYTPPQMRGGLGRGGRYTNPYNS